MINLFEYQNKIPFQDSFEGLEEFLDEIWNNREKSTWFTDPNTDDDRTESQRFLQFIHNTNQIKSNKYVGVIHYNGQRINLLPKVFYNSRKEFSTHDRYHAQSHILWWLSYCRKIRFPNYQTTLGNLNSDFFEVLIYLFSKYTRELLSHSIYRQYEEINRELPFIKGRLNTSTYISENMSKGRWHKLNCTYDAFTLDNEFNRIIKYVATLLFNVTNTQENKKNLREILFLLDEVMDKKATTEQCSRISFNPMFAEFETVRDYCQLFLSNSISFDFKNDLKLFAFLLPMEYVFEDFIFGFIEKEMDSVVAKAQRSDHYLDQDKTFGMKPDLWLQTADKSLIADTKYKIIYSDASDPKKGISQTDLYQMVAYAIRFKVKEVILFYPDTISENQGAETELIIIDALAEDVEIRIRAFQLPVIDKELFDRQPDSFGDLERLFEPAKVKLKEKLKSILALQDI